MARRASPDPETLLRRHFSREIEEERDRWTTRDGSGDAEDDPACGSPGVFQFAPAVLRRSAWSRETAAAAVLAACVGAALLTAPESGRTAVPGMPVPAEPAVLGEKAVSLSAMIGARLARAVSEFADLQSPAPRTFIVPGRFRGKD